VINHRHAPKIKGNFLGIADRDFGLDLDQVAPDFPPTRSPGVWVAILDWKIKVRLVDPSRAQNILFNCLHSYAFIALNDLIHIDVSPPPVTSSTISNVTFLYQWFCRHPKPC
jgi:hypothetical protein